MKSTVQSLVFRVLSDIILRQSRPSSNSFIGTGLCLKARRISFLRYFTSFSMTIWFLFVSLNSQLSTLNLLWARQAILSNFSGTVEAQKKGALFWLKVTPKMRLNEFEKIRTLKRSKATLLFEDGSRTMMMAETTLMLEKLVSPMNIEQNSGKTRNKVNKLGKGFSLRTPTAVCSVRGTDFGVGVGDGGVTQLNVFEGVVNGEKTATGESVEVREGQTLTFTSDGSPLGAPQPIEPPADESALKQLARKEVGLNLSREAIMSAAAEEMRLAEYREGKSLIDVNGNRVRLEEYILRKPKDVAAADQDKAFKFVVLNTRGDRLDFFTYKAIFNKALPDNLSDALKWVNRKGFIQTDTPPYYLTAYEMAQSNLTDAIKDLADGGHLVKVTANADGTYTLDAYSHDANAGGPGSVTNSQTIPSDAGYLPVIDQFLPGASDDPIYDTSTDKFITFSKGQTLWRTMFNRYAYLVGSVSELNQWGLKIDAAVPYVKYTLDNIPDGTLGKGTLAGANSSIYQSYKPVTNLNDRTGRGTGTNITTLAENKPEIDTPNVLVDNNAVSSLPGQGDYRDVQWRYLGGRVNSFVTMPSGKDKVNLRITSYYVNKEEAADPTKQPTVLASQSFDTYLISDEGKIAPTRAFQFFASGAQAGQPTGKQYKEELIKWNYQQIIRSSDFGGKSNSDLSGSRTIDIVTEPKILIKSGLIK